MYVKEFLLLQIFNAKKRTTLENNNTDFIMN